MSSGPPIDVFFYPLPTIDFSFVDDIIFQSHTKIAVLWTRFSLHFHFAMSSHSKTDKVFDFSSCAMFLFTSHTRHFYGNLFIANHLIFSIIFYSTFSGEKFRRALQVSIKSARPRRSNWNWRKLLWATRRVEDQNIAQHSTSCTTKHWDKCGGKSRQNMLATSSAENVNLTMLDNALRAWIIHRHDRRCYELVYVSSAFHVLV